jgi:hypothetical protein
MTGRGQIVTDPAIWRGWRPPRREHGIAGIDGDIEAGISLIAGRDSAAGTGGRAMISARGRRRDRRRSR